MSELVLTYSWVLFAFILTTTTTLIINKSLSADKKEISDQNKIDQDNDFVPISISVLTISDTRNEENDTSGKTLINKIKNSGHKISNYFIVNDNIENIRKKILELTGDSSVDVVITSGGTGLTGKDITFEAIEELLEKKIDGFSTIFHMISFKKIKTSTIQSRAFAGIINGTYVFCLPGSPSAVKDAWDEILVYQLDIRHKPCNLIEIKDRLKE